MGVRVHEAREDGLPRDVDDPRVLRHGHLAPRGPPPRSVVHHHDVGVLDHLVAAHGDGAGAAQHRGRPRDVARGARRGSDAAVSGSSGNASGSAEPRVGPYRRPPPCPASRPRCPRAPAPRRGRRRRARCPIDQWTTAVAAPGGELPAHLGERRAGKAARSGSATEMVGALAPDRHGHHVEVVHHLRQRAVALGRHEHEIAASGSSCRRGRRAGDLHVRLLGRCRPSASRSARLSGEGEDAAPGRG